MSSPVRTIAVVSAGRADYAICLPLLKRIQADPQLKLHLMVTGMHLSPEFGMTVRAVEDDGLKIAERIEMLLSSDKPEGVAKSMGLGTLGFAQSFARFRPDILVVLADRFEMHAAAVAALPFRIPVAHIEGGDLTEGAIDDAFRHSITKLSHLHFVSTKEYQRRVIQLGEDPWRVTVSGAPSLDNIKTLRIPSTKELERKYGVSLKQPPLLVTFHPVTQEFEKTREQIANLLQALSKAAVPIIFTLPNADTFGSIIVNAMQEFVKMHPAAKLIKNFGTQDYLGMMAGSACMVGNSSSGLIEAPSFGLPVVNIGSRQRGRTRAANVIDVGYLCEDILAGIRKALRPEFRTKIRKIKNPYGAGNASAVIVERLKNVTISEALLSKKFYNIKPTKEQPT